MKHDKKSRVRISGPIKKKPLSIADIDMASAEPEVKIVRRGVKLMEPADPNVFVANAIKSSTLESSMAQIGVHVRETTIKTKVHKPKKHRKVREKNEKIKKMMEEEEED